MKKRRLVIIGGGPAGLAAAVAAYDSGIKDVLIIERGDRLGGILLQCKRSPSALATWATCNRQRSIISASMSIPTDCSSASRDDSVLSI